MANRSRLQDVADAAGVSFITAWRALNAPQMVREQTAEKVRSAAAEIGYVTNAVARSLVTSQSGVVGVVVPTLEDSIFSATVQGLSDALTSNGVEMMIGISNYTEQREEDLTRAFVGHQVDALVLTGKTHSMATRTLLSKSNITVVEIWDVPEEPLDLYIGFSNADLTGQATRWLLEKGYSRIAFVTPKARGRAIERLAGYSDAMSKGGYESYINCVWADATLEGGANAFDQLMTAHKRPDAILFNGDTPAVGAHLHGRAKGYRYPHDVALMGIHNTAITAHVTPALSTVHIPRYEIGRRAADAILSRLSGGPGGKSEVIKFEIVARGTT